MRIACLVAVLLLAGLPLGLWRLTADEPGQGPAAAKAADNISTSTPVA
jgi:hypothetical protein